MRHVYDVDSGHRLEQLARHVVGRARPGRSVIESSRLRFGERDELLQVVRRYRGVNHEKEVGIVDRRDRHEVPHQAVGLLREQRFVYRVRIRHHEERVSVGGGFRHHVGADDRTSARPVLDYEGLSESLLQTVADKACVDVGRPTGGIGHDDFHRFRRVGGLRQHAGRDASHSDRPGDLTQQLVESHGSLPPDSDAAILGEFDALPGKRQRPRSIWRWRRPREPYRRPRPAEAAPVTRDSSFAAFRSAQAAQKTDSQPNRAAR